MSPLPVLAALVLLAPGLAAAQNPALTAPRNTVSWDTDMSGLWKVSTTLGGSAVTIDCSVLQIGADLYGSCEPEARDALPVPLVGQVNGAAASWTYEVEAQGRPARLQYQADILSGTSLNGTLTYAGAPSSFTAIRR